MDTNSQFGGAPQPQQPAPRQASQPVQQPPVQQYQQPGSQTPPPNGHQPNGSAQPNTGMAIVAYIIFFIPLLTDAKDDPFVKFHVKQGLVVVICWIATFAFSMIPVIGWIFGPLIMLGLIVLDIIGIINAATGKEKELPIIGQFAKNFHF